MFTDGGVDDPAIEQDLGGVGDIIEDGQGLLELLVVVVTQRLDPSFDFLAQMRKKRRGEVEEEHDSPV